MSNRPERSSTVADIGYGFAASAFFSPHDKGRDWVRIGAPVVLALAEPFSYVSGNLSWIHYFGTADLTRERRRLGLPRGPGELHVDGRYGVMYQSRGMAIRLTDEYWRVALDVGVLGNFDRFGAEVDGGLRDPDVNPVSLSVEYALHAREHSSFQLIGEATFLAPFQVPTDGDVERDYLAGYLRYRHAIGGRLSFAAEGGASFFRDLTTPESSGTTLEFVTVATHATVGVGYRIVGRREGAMRVVEASAK